MAIRAQRDEILFFIFARVTAKFLMMYFEISPGAAELAPPAVAAQHAFAQVFIITISKSDRHLLLQKLIHCASPFTSCCTKACLCCPGRN